MKACPRHPGIIIEHRSCYKCEPQVDSQEDMPMKALSTAESDTQVEVQTESGSVPLATVREVIERRKGTWSQPSLSDELFPATKPRDVPTIKLSFSGSVEMSVTRFLELIDDDLKTGAIVECSLSGHFKRLAVGWKKRSEGSGHEKATWWEQEGQPGIAIDDVRALYLTGETWSDD